MTAAAESHDAARRPSSATPARDANDRQPRVVLIVERERRRQRCYKLHAGGPCVFTLRDAAVLAERWKRKGRKGRKR